ncbi:MAG TPA: tRNA uridine-5-carboxymethylaminomethyl(34) synthesis GTPase MnmE [Bacteroidales bacterium]|nr:tRNA uridine-5-carboxymethylaminomethyl(34) synthesis GTPase MnmE [Bacteroidales bacterium]
MVQKGTTICAPATSGGGAIAIVRISGPDAIKMVKEIFKPSDDQIDIVSAKGYSLIFGTLSSADEFLDEVLISLFRAPLSYTGEDMVEISCHASHYIQEKIMELLIRSGSIPANPGEFTMRAFMNGKMDLSQAEAVADIIASDSEAAHRLAATQLRGGFSAEIEKLRQELLHFAALIELELDFSEEDILFADRGMMTETIIRIRSLVDTLASSFRLGNAIRKGIPVVIAGRANVGKSSLLNVLLQEERAIVSEIPGTTRDTVEEVIHLGGLMFRFIDTAGLRKETVEDKIEAQGIERTLSKVSQAAVVLAVSEATDNPDDIISFYNSVKNIQTAPGSKIILVVNKTDLLTTGQTGSLRKTLTDSGGFAPLFISARESTGIEDLKQHLIRSVETGGLKMPQYIVSNARHWHALINVSASLERALKGFRNGIPTELIATDIRQAIYFLGEITGKITSDEILGDIFKNFCIGK